MSPLFDLQLIRPHTSTRDRAAFAVAGGLWRASVILQRASARATRHAGGAREGQPGRRRHKPGEHLLTQQLETLTQAQRRELRLVDRRVRP